MYATHTGVVSAGLCQYLRLLDWFQQTLLLSAMSQCCVLCIAFCDAVLLLVARWCHRHLICAECLIRCIASIIIAC